MLAADKSRADTFQGVDSCRDGQGRRVIKQDMNMITLVVGFYHRTPKLLARTVERSIKRVPYCIRDDAFSVFCDEDQMRSEVEYHVPTAAKRFLIMHRPTVGLVV